MQRKLVLPDRDAILQSVLYLPEQLRDGSRDEASMSVALGGAGHSERLASTRLAIAHHGSWLKTIHNIKNTQ